mgnify:CR=1 FL=1
MKLNNKTYDIIKWVVMIVMPALSALYVGLGGIWGWPYIEQVAGTISCITVFLGALLVISSASYKKSTLEEESM